MTIFNSQHEGYLVRFFKKLLSFLVFVFLLLQFTEVMAQNTTAKPDSVTDMNKPIVVNEKDPTLVVRLSESGATGYQWYLAAYDRQLLKPVKSELLPPQHPNLPGAPVIRVFEFKVRDRAFIVQQMTRIQFANRRSWENNSGQTQVVYVLIQVPPPAS